MVCGVPKPDVDMFRKLGIKAEMQAIFTEQIETVQIVFEENWLALAVFLAVQTQWRIVAGMQSTTYTGLDYAAVKAALDLMCVRKKQHAEIFEDIRIMESEWLSEHLKMHRPNE